MYVRYFIGGPSDGQRQEDVSSRRPKLIGRTVSGGDLKHISVYEYDGERTVNVGSEFIYRFKFTLRRDEAMRFMKENKGWV